MGCSIIAIIGLLLDLKTYGPFAVACCSFFLKFLQFVGPAKVNKVKIFSGPCYMIKCVLTFVLGVQESVLVDFISQNKVKILHKIKIRQNCLHQTFPYKNEQI